MRTIFYLLAIVVCFKPSALHAQTLVPDLIADYACDSVTISVHDPLNQGKVLVVLYQALNCPKCQASGIGWGTFADTAHRNITVWARLDWMNGTPATCADHDMWLRTSGRNWHDIYIFSSRIFDAVARYDWFKTFCEAPSCEFPSYTVIDPATKTIAYKGNDATKARQIATRLANRR